MKTKLLLMLLLVGPILAMAQKGETNYFLRLEKLGYTEVEWTFMDAMKKVAKGLDKGWKVEEGESWNIEQGATIKINKNTPVVKYIQMATNKGAKLQKAMANFEMECYKEKDDKHSVWIVVEAEFRKNPGYSFKAMSARMEAYIQKMESVSDDE